MPSACFNSQPINATNQRIGNMPKAKALKKSKRGVLEPLETAILWLTPCKLACERSLVTGPNIVASVGDGRSW